MAQHSQVAAVGAVLLEDGSIYTWGSNGTGALGLGPGSCRTARHAMIPQRVALAVPALEIAALDDLVCARLVGGRIACWGGASSPRASDCGVPTLVTTPRGVPLSGMARMEVGVALDDRGILHAWGHDEYGQVSRRPDSAERLPNRRIAHVVEGIPPAVDVGSSGTATCVLTERGEVLCWGDILMRARGADRLMPSDAEDLGRAVTEPTPFGSPAPARAIFCVVAGCMVLAGDHAYQRGSARLGEHSPWPIPPDVTSVGLGFSSGCFERSDGFHCWGAFHPELPHHSEPAPVRLHE